MKFHSHTSGQAGPVLAGPVFTVLLACTDNKMFALALLHQAITHARTCRMTP